MKSLNNIEKILIYIGRKKRLRLYDILSIISISYYASKISLERFASSYSDIDFFKTFIYLSLASVLYLFYSIYQDYYSIHQDISQSIQSIKDDTENPNSLGYDDIFTTTVIESSYKKNISTKLCLFLFFSITSIGLYICYSL